MLRSIGKQSGKSMESVLRRGYGGKDLQKRKVISFSVSAGRSKVGLLGAAQSLKQESGHGASVDQQVVMSHSKLYLCFSLCTIILVVHSAIQGPNLQNII